MESWLYTLYADNKKLPNGTRIKTTYGGIHTGGDHELSKNVLDAANRCPNHMSDYVPFWILGWTDLHSDLLPPIVCADDTATNTSIASANIGKD